ncbi:MAG: sigma-70 family RNA polymerase sigma factor [Planctomycetes bacterium]|nr:sigma-70 family RNA polymerase sigma factor [Planctomycetota bacterium]
MSGSSESESGTLRHLARGDPAALAAWFEGNVDSLYAFAFYRVGSDPDLAADATQATFALALERLGDFDPSRGSMATWLRLLSRNIIRDLLLHHRRAAQLQEAWDNVDASLARVFERIDREPLPDAALEREETRELVGMALANLPPQYREVLEAKYMDGHPLEAIARMRSATVDSVKAMLRRARAAFRETMLAIAKSGAI